MEKSARPKRYFTSFRYNGRKYIGRCLIHPATNDLLCCHCYTILSVLKLADDLPTVTIYATVNCRPVLYCVSRRIHSHLPVGNVIRLFAVPSRDQDNVIILHVSKHFQALHNLICLSAGWGLLSRCPSELFEPTPLSAFQTPCRHPV